jgi:hypothetical protein
VTDLRLIFPSFVGSRIQAVVGDPEPLTFLCGCDEANNCCSHFPASISPLLSFCNFALPFSPGFLISNLSRIAFANLVLGIYSATDLGKVYGRQPNGIALGEAHSNDG